ncbi:hypothetical protein ACEQ8H_004840 [Pleosporales sp. CAS-2024a]
MGSLTDWGGLTTSSEPTSDLERAHAGNLNPTSNEIALYATHTRLDQASVRNWFDNQRAPSLHDQDSSHFSEYSGPTNTPFPYPASVPNDLQSIASWTVDKNATPNDSGFNSNSSADSGSLAYLDSYRYPPDYSGLLHLGPDPHVDVPPQPLQADPLPAVAWNLRSVGPHSLFDPAYDLAVNSRSSRASTKNDAPPYSGSGRSATVSLAERLRPCAVSSEVIGSKRSRSRGTSIRSHGDDATTCEQCGTKFTGRYARGNCSRHVRQLHSAKPSRPNSDLICRLCGKEFKRQDAKRKHEWRKHHCVDTKPIPRRPQGGSTYQASHTSVYKMEGDHETATCATALAEDPSTTIQYHLPAMTHRAYCEFATARASLSNEHYNLFCQAVLNLCTRIVEALKAEQPNLYPVFLQQSRDLHAQLTRGEDVPLRSGSFSQPVLSKAQDGGLDREEASDFRQDKGKAPMSRRTSKALARTHPYAGRPTKKAPADGVFFDALEDFEPPADQKLDCPIHKWHLMYHQPSPCNGCGKLFMNGVRQHLLPTYSRQHRGQLPFIQRCENCKDDFVDESSWNEGGHSTRRQPGTGSCHARSQAQGSNIVVWARLFLKIHPNENRVPSPYRNDEKLLPAHFVALLRNDLRLSRDISANFAQTAPAPTLTIQDADMQQDNGVASLNLAERPSLMNAELEGNAATDTLVARATEVLTQFLAQEFVETNHERVDLDAIKRHFTSALNELRQNAWIQLSQRRQPHAQPGIDQGLLLPAEPDHAQAPYQFNQAHDPASGGADDFSNVPYTSQQYMGQAAESEVDTHSSTFYYTMGDTSRSYPSITRSSRTSHDFGRPPSHMEQSQDTVTQFCSPDDRIDDYSPSTRFGNQYLSQHEYLLDQPGSSQLAQQLAAPDYNLEYDLMMTSPSETQHPLMDTDVDDAFAR